MAANASKGRDIAPATGRLGVLLPGMGAVATTFVAGVEAIRRGLSKPIGSLTQMGTIRLGKRTDGRCRKQQGLARMVMVWGGSTEVYRQVSEVHATIESFERGLEQSHADILP